VQVQRKEERHITVIQPIEFQAWPKTPRLMRDMIVTEKIDGTNAAVVVMRSDVEINHDEIEPADLYDLGAVAAVQFDGITYLVGAQSRKRMIFPGKDTDNAGFAKWVQDNALGLALHLGAGVHYGEWWGGGIQRGYGVTAANRRFSLFNVHRYKQAVHDNAQSEGEDWVPGLRVVPVLAEATFSMDVIEECLESLRNNGSVAEPGYKRPEGIIVFHSASRQVYKVLLENDAQPKGMVA
jgi:hypothetical protein